MADLQQIFDRLDALEQENARLKALVTQQGAVIDDLIAQADDIEDRVFGDSVKDGDEYNPIFSILNGIHCEVLGKPIENWAEVDDDDDLPFIDHPNAISSIEDFDIKKAKAA